MKRPEYSRQFRIGADEGGRGVFITVELQHRGPVERETVTHEKVTEWLELSLSGVVQGASAGQIRDTLDHLSYITIPEEQVRRIAKVWDRWHLNGMKPGCIHQVGWDKKPIDPSKPLNTYGKHFPGQRSNSWNMLCWVTPREYHGGLLGVRCLQGYAYGSAWLVDPLPEEVAAEVRTWGMAQPDRDLYAEQAQEFLSRFGLEIRAAFKDAKAPKWAGNGPHGDHYRVTVKRLPRPGVEGRPAPGTISFDFWNSQVDMQAGRRPTEYGILSCLSSDAHLPTDPDEVVSEFGEMPPSQAVAAAKFAAKLQAFFTEEELQALAEIR